MPTQFELMSHALAESLRDVTLLFASQPAMSLDMRQRVIGENMSRTAGESYLASAMEPVGSPARTYAMLYADALFHMAHLHSPTWYDEYARLFGAADVPYSGDFANYCMDAQELLAGTYIRFMEIMGLEKMALLEPDNAPLALDHAAAMCYVRFQSLRRDYGGMHLTPRTDEPAPVVEPSDIIAEDPAPETTV